MHKAVRVDEWEDVKVVVVQERLCDVVGSVACEEVQREVFDDLQKLVSVERRIDHAYHGRDPFSSMHGSVP